MIVGLILSFFISLGIFMGVVMYYYYKILKDIDDINYRLNKLEMRATKEEL